MSERVEAPPRVEGGRGGRREGRRVSGNVGASDGRVSGRVSGSVSGRVSGGSAGGSAGTGAQSATAAGATVNPAPLLSMCSLFLTKKKTKAKQKTMLDSFV